MKLTLLVATLSLALAAAPAPAQSKDVEGSKDSPLVSRYPGSVIDNYKSRQFDEFNFPVGAVTPQGMPKSLHLEGRWHDVVVVEFLIEVNTKTILGVASVCACVCACEHVSARPGTCEHIVCVCVLCC